MKIPFNDVSLAKIANGNGTICRYSTVTHLITIDIIDPETDQHVACLDFDVDDAIELRDWLNAAIPSVSIGGMS